MNQVRIIAASSPPSTGLQPPRRFDLAIDRGFTAHRGKHGLSDTWHPHVPPCNEPRAGITRNGVQEEQDSHTRTRHLHRNLHLPNPREVEEHRHRARITRINGY